MLQVLYSLLIINVFTFSYSMTNPPVAILWDVDGTLAQTTSLGYTSTNYVLTSQGKPLITEQDYHIGCKFPTPERFSWHMTGDPVDETGIGKKLGALFDEYYVKLVSIETAPLYPGIEQLLHTLKGEFTQKLYYGALSNACGDYARAVLKANMIDTIFEFGLGADDVRAAKPSPLGLLECCSKLSIDPKDCLYIGDSPTDGQAASAAGMNSIGVGWGSNSAESLSYDSTLVVTTVEDLEKELKKFLVERQINK